MPTDPLGKIKRELVRPAKQFGRFVYQSASGVYSPFIYDRTQRSKVIVSPGALALSDHACIYVIAPFFGVWPSHRMALDYMVGSGVSPVVVSNVSLSEKEKASISETSAVVIERPNQGYDFGAYRDAIWYLRDQLDSFSRLTLLNDSTWFPAPGSRNWFDSILQSDVDVIGATSNFGGSTHVPETLSPQPWEYGPKGQSFHLQSFALSISSRVLKDPEFYAFWNKYPLVNDKELTVKRGEIGFSNWAARQKWTLTSTYPIEQLDSLLAALPLERLRQISECIIVLGNPRFQKLKHDVLKSAADAEKLRLFILAAARCLGVSYALPDYNLNEMRFPFLKKSPVWHQKEASDITLNVIRSFDEIWGIEEEALYLRRALLQE